jgi:hypothetical protein
MSYGAYALQNELGQRKQNSLNKVANQKKTNQFIQKSLLRHDKKVVFNQRFSHR